MLTEAPKRRGIKGEIKFELSLTEEQRLVKASVYNRDVTFVLGDYGTGKTLSACQIALELLFKKHVEKIIITRPIDFEKMGYLKGNMDEKMAYHVMPMKQNFYMTYKKELIDEYFKDGIIQILPIDIMKGMTFVNSITIVDEFEDISYEEFKLILTRLGRGSKLIFTGSAEQTDKKVKDSCINQIKKLENSDLVGYHTLTVNHRNEDIAKIIEYIENTDKKNNEK